MNKAKHPKQIPKPWDSIEPEDVIIARRDYLEQRSTLIAFLIKLAVIALIAWAVTSFIFGFAVMKGEGMYPRVRDGDLMIYYRLQDQYHVGDVVTFNLDGARYTGRIVARGGDSVDISDSSELLINGNVQSEEIFYPTEKPTDSIAFPCKVEPESVFLLGDMRTGCTDSRSYGTVAQDDLDGKVISIVRRRGI